MGRFNMEILVIGAGLSGAVVAHELAARGHDVEVWERRSQVGGNLYDEVDDHGILVHRYGPHTFHTKKKELYDYLCRFAEWDPYYLTCGAEIDGQVVPTPFNFKTMDAFYAPAEAEALKEAVRSVFAGRDTATVTEVMQAADALVRQYGAFLFAKDYSLYTAKQWGIPASEVDPSVLRRVPLRFSYEERYFDDAYQVLPRHRYMDLFDGLLRHENIRVRLGVDALHHLRISEDGTQVLIDGERADVTVVYTGALDELFTLDEGALPYRSLRFEWRHEEIASKQPYPIVAYPASDGFTRITEYTKMPVQQGHGTTYAIEYPLRYEYGKGMEPYYPLLTEESQRQAARYREKAARVRNLFCCGRLADFKYYNMDQALERALALAREI